VRVYLLAHGSADARHAADVAAIAERLGGGARPCFLDLNGPALAEAADEPGVVVPLLFSPGYHVQVDVGAAVAGAEVPLRVAAPPLLTWLTRVRFPSEPSLNDVTAPPFCPSTSSNSPTA